MYCRLLTGRLFLNIRSRPTFLIRRLTIAHFHLSEKEPEDKDKLMILVITGRSQSMQLTTNGAGIGQSVQVFFAERSINLAT